MSKKEEERKNGDFNACVEVRWHIMIKATFLRRREHWAYASKHLLILYTIVFPGGVFGSGHLHSRVDIINGRFMNVINRSQNASTVRATKWCHASCRKIPSISSYYCLIASRNSVIILCINCASAIKVRKSSHAIRRADDWDADRTKMLAYLAALDAYYSPTDPILWPILASKKR